MGRFTHTVSLCMGLWVIYVTSKLAFRRDINEQGIYLCVHINESPFYHGCICMQL